MVAFHRAWATYQWSRSSKNQKHLSLSQWPWVVHSSVAMASYILCMQLFKHICYLVQVSGCINLSFEINSIIPRDKVCQPQAPHLMSQACCKWAAWMELWEILTTQALVSLQSRITFWLPHIFCKPTEAFYICLKVEQKLKKKTVIFLSCENCVTCLHHHVKVLWEGNDSHSLVCPPWQSRVSVTHWKACSV